MTQATLTVVVPTYGAFEYAAEAVASIYRNTKKLAPRVTVVDDATPQCDNTLAVRTALHATGVIPAHVTAAIVRHRNNAGLTACWNTGLRIARMTGDTYTCVTNSDVIFSPGWDIALLDAIDSGLTLVGPVTNAPGSETAQDVCRWLPEYKLSDRERDIANTAEALAEKYADDSISAVVSNINGFCMLARTADWWDNAYDAEHVFAPLNLTNSKGQPNPTPTMTLNEYEFQRRLKKNHGRAGFCPASFVFHYRSVSRGHRYRSKGWYRRPGDR